MKKRKASFENIQHLNIIRENDVIHLIVKYAEHLTFVIDHRPVYEMVAI
jgi:hypothetical protein